MGAVPLSASILSPKIPLNLMSSSPSLPLPDQFFQNLDDHSFPVVNSHNPNAVTGDDEEEQRLDEALHLFDLRAEETVVCFRLFLYNTELRFRPEYRPELCQLGTGRVEQ